ncbi:MAG: HsdM family class I SAM-dependent methyltransferase [Tractidigestivibacter sp.]|jgi:adenine-specific DNA-methyltransferase|uniref:HsdM family class I SAM-dependent methyltransferase n=1 Tax=Tractidigestivibacter sp. TaxID=2847320 RepID=UPI003D8B39D8
MAFGATLTQDEDPQESRKERGAFFTPKEIADFLCDEVLSNRNDRVLEPACGEAEFLLSAADKLFALGASCDEVSQRLFGCELHHATADAARERLAKVGVEPTILVDDFFELSNSMFSEKFDAVVGNPPFIRYQSFTGSVRSRARKRAFAMGVRLDALASSWAPFLVHATSFLKVGGKVGMVLPAELLSTNYAAPVRKYLLDSFCSIELILFEKPVFPEVTEEVVLLIANGFQSGNSDSIKLVQVADVSELCTDNNSVAKVHGYMKWPTGNAARDAFELLEKSDSHGLVDLASYGDIHLGAVTGSNEYFALSRDKANQWGIPAEDLLPLCPPGSRHLRNLSITQRDYKRLADQGKQVLLFYPHDGGGEATSRYLVHGEKSGVSHAYKCRTRNPWWRVPGVRSCDLFFTYMNGIGPNLCSNDANLVFLNSVHGMFLRSEFRSLAKETLPLATLNSVTLLSAELVGRSYGGGILKLEPREAGKMLVPNYEFLDASRNELLSIKGEVSELLSSGKRDGATMLVDDVLLPMMGFPESDRTKIHRLLLEMRGRRMGRGKEISRRGGQRGGR